ncbi:MAG TPA: ERCC4 domain-containing protein [Acidimicrobiales bacterium]|nr:ERCC4 domain-containing protein [Acidimicrobiales bacterium]
MADPGSGAARFVVASNPDTDSKLPYLLRLPLAGGELLLKARDRWPRTAAVYCHRASEWPEGAEVLEETAVRSCARRGRAIDLVLDRYRENRSQFVLTSKSGRELILWQSARTTAKARPGVRVPTRRASALDELVVAVDSRERYPWRFARQQVRTERRALPTGDYGVFLGEELVGAVERKSLADLAGSLVDGSLAYALADLATLRRASLVVEDRWPAVFKLEHVKPGWVAELLAAVQVRYPNVPIVFCETRPLAEEWAYRWLAAALVFARAEAEAGG